MVHLQYLMRASVFDEAILDMGLTNQLVDRGDACAHIGDSEEGSKVSRVATHHK